MGVDLKNETGQSFSVNWEGWRHLLHLGQEFGWDPEGTVNPEIDQIEKEGDTIVVTGPKLGWSGSYFFNEFQTVTKSDAAALATALSAAVRVGAYGDNRRFVEKFIDFCRGGSFYIW